MKMFDICGRTEKGPVRSTNEDHILVGRFIKNSGHVNLQVQLDDDYLAAYGMIFAIADGVGGESGGAVASRLALGALDAQFYSVEKGSAPTDKAHEILRAAGERANQTLLSMQVTKPEFSRMGCTLTGVCLIGERWLWFNAGDSRVYRFRDGFLKQITRDDSVTALALEMGAMSAHEAEKSSARHTILNLAGSRSFSFEIDNGRELKDSDILLVCSDGLHDLVPIEQLEKLLAEDLPVSDLADRLVCQATMNGGKDNISVILIRRNGTVTANSNEPHAL